LEQCNGGKLKYGSINTMEELNKNLAMNCIPLSIATMDASKYTEFLEERRKLMALKIKQYFTML